MNVKELKAYVRSALVELDREGIRVTAIDVHWKTNIDNLNTPKPEVKIEPDISIDAKL